MTSATIASGYTVLPMIMTATLSTVSIEANEPTISIQPISGRVIQLRDYEPTDRTASGAGTQIFEDLAKVDILSFATKLVESQTDIPAEFEETFHRHLEDLFA